MNKKYVIVIGLIVILGAVFFVVKKPLTEISNQESLYIPFLGVTAHISPEVYAVGPRMENFIMINKNGEAYILLYPFPSDIVSDYDLKKSDIIDTQYNLDIYDMSESGQVAFAVDNRKMPFVIFPTENSSIGDVLTFARSLEEGGIIRKNNSFVKTDEHTESVESTPEEVTTEIYGQITEETDGEEKRYIDGTIKYIMQSVKIKAEIYFDEQVPKSYGPNVKSCAEGMFASESIAESIREIAEISGSAVQCSSSGKEFAIVAQLVADPNIYWCVEYTGLMIEISSPGLLDGSTSCD